MSWGDGAIYNKLGVRPFVNAQGHGTFVGGRNHAAVQEAIDSAGLLFVDTRELQANVGEYIAELLGVEAALPTPGCAAAVMFSIAGCMAGNDVEKQRRIPDTTGMKNQVVLQGPHRYAANRMYEVPGRHHRLRRYRRELHCGRAGSGHRAGHGRSGLRGPPD